MEKVNGMSNGQCHIGAANRASIEANEKRIADISRTVSEMVEKLQQSHQALLARMDKLNDEFTRKLERLSERLANRPSWALMLLLSTLSSFCVGLVVYVLKQ
jgi:GTP-binding protein EngB required for normal cell division